MKTFVVLRIGLTCSLDLLGQKAAGFNKLDMNLGNPCRMSDASPVPYVRKVSQVYQAKEARRFPVLLFNRPGSK